MTDEELDRARAEEAWRVWQEKYHGFESPNYGVIAARLARTGWTPPPKVDSDVLEVRELLAKRAEANGFDAAAIHHRSGAWDNAGVHETALAAFRRGREIERANPSKDD